MTDARREPPLMIPPDPEVVAEALTDLMVNTAAAVRTTLTQAASPQPLPYDPATLGKAILAFNTAVMTQPMALFEAQAKTWTDWTALWRTMGERAIGGSPEPVIAPAKGDAMHFSGSHRCDYMRQCFNEFGIR